MSAITFRNSRVVGGLSAALIGPFTALEGT